MIGYCANALTKGHRLLKKACLRLRVISSMMSSQALMLLSDHVSPYFGSLSCLRRPSRCRSSITSTIAWVAFDCCRLVPRSRWGCICELIKIGTGSFVVYDCNGTRPLRFSHFAILDLLCLDPHLCSSDDNIADIYIDDAIDADPCEEEWTWSVWCM